MITAITSEEETYQRCKALLTGSKPGLLARIGGSDTDALISYTQHRGDADKLKHSINMVKTYNGFYDLGDKIEESYNRYLDTLKDCYTQSDEFLICTPTFLTLYFKARIGDYIHKNQEELDDVQHFLAKLFDNNRQIAFHPYDFAERLISTKFTLFNLFSEILPGKRVLVVSPFSESIHRQQARRHALLRDFKYPEFEVLTYEVPVTYSGLPREMYPDSSWHHTLERMKKEISELDFDIALMACGSYAMPLGIHIRDVCQKHAAYVGGCLQLFFGIMGRRWSDLPFFTDQLYAENFISPSEGDKYKKQIDFSPSMLKEAFGAYF